MAETTTPAQVKKHRLRKGEKAPFAGVLLTNAALAKLITDADKAIALEKAAREKAARTHKAETKAAKATADARELELTLKLGSCNADMQRRETIWTGALSKCSRAVPWYKHPIFGFVVGNVTAAGLCIGVSRAK